MTHVIAFAPAARAAQRAGAASCALAAMAHAAIVTMRKGGVVAPVARSPGLGRS